MFNELMPILKERDINSLCMKGIKTVRRRDK